MMRGEGTVNRKQNIAIVVGMVVIVLLLLFPPWRLGDGTSDFPGWSYQHGPAWIGSPPEGPIKKPVLPAFQEFMAQQVEKLQGGMPERAGSTEQVVEGTSAVTVNWGHLIAHLLAALALTIAAVLVLKDKKS